MHSNNILNWVLAFVFGLTHLIIVGRLGIQPQDIITLVNVADTYTAISPFTFHDIFEAKK